MVIPGVGPDDPIGKLPWSLLGSHRRGHYPCGRQGNRPSLLGPKDRPVFACQPVGALDCFGADILGPYTGPVVLGCIAMWQTFIFGMHWSHGGKTYYDELSADSQEEAAEYFIDHKRDDVYLIRVELVGPDDSGVREYAHSPVSPFSPLMARRRLDKDEDAR